MFSKLNIKTLAVLLVILLAVFAAIQYTDTSDSSYRDDVINIDTASITKIKIESKKEEPFQLIKEQQSWFVQSGDKKSDADLNKIKNLLAQMSPLKPMRVAGNSKNQWKQFGLEDDAIKIAFCNGDKVLSTLFLGKVSFQEPETSGSQNLYSRGNRGTMIGYARANDDEVVYVVDGYLKLSYGDNANAFKKKVLVNTEPDNISKVAIQSGEASFSLLKKDNKWMMDGQPVDSANMAKYINTLVRLRSYDFLNQDALEGLKPVGSVAITSNNQDLITVDAYSIDSVTVALVSSQNNGNIIKDKDHRLFDSLIKDKNWFLKQ